MLCRWSVYVLVLVARWSHALRCTSTSLPEHAHHDVGPLHRWLFGRYSWSCDDGFVRRKGSVCCKKSLKPRGAIWIDESCEWRRRYPLELLDEFCVSPTVSEVVLEAHTKTLTYAVDDLIDTLVEDRLSELWDDFEHERRQRES